MLANSYLKANVQAKQGFDYVFDKYLHFMKYKKYKNVLDVGCRPGDIISKSLLPALSKSCKKMIGVDISKDMVNYANTQNRIDPRIDFRKMDISTETLPKDFKNEFDFVTSFYCFNFVEDHKKALQNMLEMLRPGGEVFVTFMSKAHWVGRQKQFQDFINGVTKTVTPSFNRPKEDFEKNILNVGFEIHYSHIEERNIIYDKDTYIDIVKATTAFKMPCQLVNSFMSAFLDGIKAKNLISVDNGKEYVNSPYSILVFYGRKPL